ncbi:MAG: ArsR family transcriptional regulator [Halobacteriales archaeon]|nr:ArsR family transcriptional regulator [Halobacteriales archaeon]
MRDETLEDAPPSAKLVYKVLEFHGALTQKEIVEQSMLAQRTVRDALARLRRLGVVTERVYIPDARQDLYELSSGDPPADSGSAKGAET